MAKTGLSESETMVVQALVGRREDFLARCAARETDTPDKISANAFMEVLESLGVDTDANTVELLACRYDVPLHTGKVVGYRAFASAMKTLLDAPFHPTHSAALLKNIGFEPLPGFENKRAARLLAAGRSGGAGAAAPPSGVASPFARPEIAPLQLPAVDPFSPHYQTQRLAVSPAAAASPFSAVSPARAVPPKLSPASVADSETSRLSGSHFDGGDFAAAQAILRRIADATGARVWSNIAADMVREAAFGASPLSGTARPGGLDLGAARSHGSPGSSTLATLRLGEAALGRQGAVSPRKGGASELSVVPAAVLQRALAKVGLALTPRELRILSSRFAPPPSRVGDRAAVMVDIAALGREVC